MRMNRFFSIIAILVVAASPSAAAAQTCYSLNSDRQSINREASGLAEYEWGSALVLAGCVAAGMNSYNHDHDESNAIAAVTVCAGAGCGLTTNYRNCLSVCTRLFLYALQASLIEARMRDIGC